MRATRYQPAPASKRPAPTLSCPFCGAHSEDLVILEIDAGNHAVTCESCHAIGPQDIDQENAIALWNGAALHALNLAAKLYPEEALSC